MANPVNINVGAIKRPGVFVTQSSTGGLPQPIASHAIGYVFGSTPTDPYDATPIDEYSALQPYKPTQIGSLADFTAKIGGVPTAANNPNSMISYDSVGAFFENVGVNGILYYTRVTPTPETKVVVTKGAGWNLFSLKIGGRYFGDTSLGINDADGIEIRVITTTALDANDNAFDVVGYLKNSDPDFKTYFRIEQDDEEAKAASFRIYSKDVRSLPEISSFKAYQISDTAYATPTDAATVSFYVPIKELALRCNSRDVTTNEPIKYVSGGALGNFIEAASVSTNTNGTSSFRWNQGTGTNEGWIDLVDIDALDVGTDAVAAGDLVVFEGVDPGTANYVGTGDISGVGNVSYNKAYKIHSVDASNNRIKLQDPASNSAAILNFSANNTTIVLRVRRLVYNVTKDVVGGSVADSNAVTDADVQGVVAQALEDFLIDQKIYASASVIPDDVYVAISTDERVGKLEHNALPDIGSQYYQWDTSGTAFAVSATVPNGSATSVGNNITRTGYLPDTVQVFYLNIAGENRAIIANGATPAELTNSVRDSINEILEEKSIEEFYKVESIAVDYATPLGANNFAPNNGLQVSTSPSTAGSPALRPSNDGRQLTGTIAVTSGSTTIQGTLSDEQAGTITDLTAVGVLTGSGTNFQSIIAPGYRILVNSATYEVVEVYSNTTILVKNPAETTFTGQTHKLRTVATKFTEELYEGAPVVINGYRFEVASAVTRDDQFVVTSAPTFTVSSTSASLDSSAANGFYRHDYLLRLKITSKNGIPSPVVAGLNRYGIKDTNIARIGSLEEAPDFANYKLSAKSRAQDFVYAIEQGMGSGLYQPGFLLAPEAFGSFKTEVGGLTKNGAREERVKVTQSLLRAAEGKLGETEGISGTQHIALIDCGADESSLSEVQDELAYIKRTAGVPFGHAAYYAPYIKNLAGRFVPPSAFIAGIACSRYNNEGFQQAPAGARYPLRGATALRFDITAQQQEVTYPLGLNPIRSLPNRGIVAWGARTMSSNQLFKFVNTRAILNVLIDVMARSFDDILFEQIDSAGTLYSRAKSIASQVMGQLYRQGALFGARPEQAYLVVCSDANNALADLENGTLRLDAYVATSPTLERLVVTVVRTPAGQVAQVQDTFSRNVDRFDYLLNNTTI